MFRAGSDAGMRVALSAASEEVGLAAGRPADATPATREFRQTIDLI